MRQMVPAEQIDRIFAEWDRPDSPGCALAVIREGEIIYVRGYGSANLEYGLPITPASVFLVGSVAKQVTACALLLLARDQLLALDDPVRTYVPDAPSYLDVVTLRHLLYHTSGLRDHWAMLRLADYPDDSLYTEADIMDLLHRQRGLVTRPGEAFSYSNPGYILLSMVIHRVGGRSLRAFTHERIFAPLEMHHTQFQDDRRMLVRHRADGHEPSEGGGWRLLMPHSDLVGNGGLMTTVEDLAHWDSNFYTAAVGGDDVITQMLTPGVLNNGHPILSFGHRYAAGLLLGDYCGLSVVHHPGGNTGYRAQLVRFPALRFSVACLGNLCTIDPTALAFRVAQLYLDEELGPPAPLPPVLIPQLDIALSAAHKAELPGLYDSAELGTTFSVVLQEGMLWLHSRRGQKWRLRPAEIDADSFIVDDLEAGQLSIIREAEALSGFYLSTYRATHIAFSKRR